jgi:Tfp pilus assembly protein PilF
MGYIFLGLDQRVNNMKHLIATLIAVFVAFSAAQATTSTELIDSGNNYWSQGKLAEAETAFKQALEINPESSQASERLASLYLTQNKTGAAITAYQDAITLDPENARLFIGIAIAYLHQRYYQMAESMVSHAIELDPDLENAQKLKQYLDAKKQVNSSEPDSEAATTAPNNDPHSKAAQQD